MSEWRPIGTAPKDGQVLGWWPDGDDEDGGDVYKMEWVDWPDDGPQWIPEYCEVMMGQDCQPTHWMPLPAPPSMEMTYE